MKIQHVSRQGWEARDPRNVERVDKAHRRRYVIHHSTGRNLGDRNLFQWVRNIQAFHMDTRGWWDIGYNEVYAYDPEDDVLYVFEGRGWDAQGAHVAGHNIESIGGCFLGNYEDGHDVFTVDMWQFVKDRQTRLEQHIGRDLTLTGHGDLASTACPGDQILRAIHGNPPAGGAPQPEPPDWTEELIMALPVVESGDRSAAVRRAQSLLASAGVPPDNSFARNHEPDGIFGPGTRRAVQAFQETEQVRNSVRGDGTGDGIVGRFTWTALLGQ